MKLARISDWKNLPWREHVPRLLGGLIAYRDTPHLNHQDRLDAGAAAGHMTHTAFAKLGQHKVRSTLAAWKSENKNQRFSPADEKDDLRVPRQTYTYYQCVMDFERELLTWKAMPYEPYASLVPICAEAGDLRLVRGVLGVERDDAFELIVAREKALARPVLGVIDLTAVGTSSEDRQLSQSNLVPLVTLAADFFDVQVSVNSLPHIFKNRPRPPLLAIKGFAPQRDPEGEWRSLLRLIKRLQPVTSVMLFQSADPCHNPALATESVSMRFTIADLPSSGAIDAGRVFAELRDCCQRVLVQQQFDSADQECVVELESARLLMRDDRGAIVGASAMSDYLGRKRVAHG